MILAASRALVLARATNISFSFCCIPAKSVDTNVVYSQHRLVDLEQVLDKLQRGVKSKDSKAAYDGSLPCHRAMYSHLEEIMKGCHARWSQDSETISFVDIEEGLKGEPCIYIVVDAKTGRLKVGMTFNGKERQKALEALKSQSYRDFRVLYTGKEAVQFINSIDNTIVPKILNLYLPGLCFEKSQLQRLEMLICMQLVEAAVTCCYNATGTRTICERLFLMPSPDLTPDKLR